MVVPVVNISSSAQVQEILTRAACGASSLCIYSDKTELLMIFS